MKLINILSALVLAFSVCSCSSLGSTTAASGSNNSAAFTSGTNCGSALAALTQIYKSKGSIELSNPSVLLQLASLATSTSNLKENLKDKSYYTGFANGTVSSSNNLVSTSTVGNVLNSLTGIDMSGFTNASSAVSSASNATSTVSSVLSVLNMLKK